MQALSNSQISDQHRPPAREPGTLCRATPTEQVEWNSQLQGGLQATAQQSSRGGGSMEAIGGKV